MIQRDGGRLISAGLVCSPVVWTVFSSQCDCFYNCAQEQDGFLFFFGLSLPEVSFSFNGCKLSDIKLKTGGITAHFYNMKTLSLGDGWTVISLQH